MSDVNVSAILVKLTRFEFYLLTQKKCHNLHRGSFARGVSWKDKVAPYFCERYPMPLSSYTDNELFQGFEYLKNHPSASLHLNESGEWNFKRKNEEPIDKWPQFFEYSIKELRNNLCHGNKGLSEHVHENPNRSDDLIKALDAFIDFAIDNIFDDKSKFENIKFN